MDNFVDEQIAYYRARAPEYDDWIYRRGRYDRGAELNRQWAAELDEVARALEGVGPRGKVLELAGGTGYWTGRLVRRADRVTVVDAAPEMLAINRARVGDPRVRYVQADLFDWQPDDAYDVVFFGFSLSHVPPERFAAFWDLVGRCLAPGGRVFFVDSRYDARSTAVDHRLEGPDRLSVRRRLNDGREFEIVKVFYDPADLSGRLAGLGWDFDVATTASYFLYGSGARREGPRLGVEEFPDGLATIRRGAGGEQWQGADYQLGVAAKTVGASQLSLNVSRLPPGGSIPAHVHEGFEVALYVLGGRVEHRFGPGLRSVLVNGPGDFIFVKPGVPHAVKNLSDSEPVVVVVARSTPDEWDRIRPYDPAQDG
jgi:demethylmenaquinone methyltransferase/2-methoxy-6-polyprenyl-1,4-benzoquinol methylase